MQPTKLLLASSILLALNPLHAAEQALDPIKVSVTKAEMAPEDVAASFSIVTAKEIRQSGAKDVMDAIRRTTGVSAGVNSSSISGRKAIQIRGMSSSHVLIMIDGKRLTNTDAQVGHSNFQLNALPIESVDHIEIVRGPMSSLYGSAGMAGVVNIVTKKAGEKWQSAVDLYAGELDNGNGGDESSLAFSTRGRIGEYLSVNLGVESSYTQPTEDKDGDLSHGVLITEMEGKNLDTYNAGLVLKFNPQHQVSLDTNRADEHRNKAGSKYYDIENHIYSVGYKGHFGDLTVDAKAYESYSDDYFIPRSYHHYLTDTVFTIDLIKSLSESSQLILGSELRREEYKKNYDDPTKTDFKGEADYTSVFVQNDLSFMDDRLGVTLGLRYDDHEKFGDEFSPKVYLDYEVNDEHRINLGYGHGFKAPTVTESSDDYHSYIPFGGGVGHSFVGNSSLQPETSDSLELSWEYQSGSTHTRAALFYNDIEDLIIARDTGTTEVVFPFTYDIHQYSNVSTAITQGLELEFSRPITDALEFAANYTYLDTEDGDNDDKQLPYRSHHSGNVLLTHHYVPWGLTTALNWEYIGSQYMDDAEDDKVPGYSLLDLTLSKKLTSIIELRAGVTNISDTRLKEKDDNFDTEERGRFYFVGARMTF